MYKYIYSTCIHIVPTNTFLYTGTYINTTYCILSIHTYIHTYMVRYPATYIGWFDAKMVLVPGGGGGLVNGPAATVKQHRTIIREGSPGPGPGDRQTPRTDGQTGPHFNMEEEEEDTVVVVPPPCR